MLNKCTHVKAGKLIGKGDITSLTYYFDCKECGECYLKVNK